MRRLAGMCLAWTLALAAFAAPAAADDATMLALAAEHHGQAAPCDVQVTLVPMPPDDLGQMYWGTCAIEINSVHFPKGDATNTHAYCAVLVHEYGHVLGLTFDNPSDPLHSPDPASPMYWQPSVDHAPAVCDRFLPVRTTGPRIVVRIKERLPCWAKRHRKIKRLYSHGERAQARKVYRRLVRTKKIKKCA